MPKVLESKVVVKVDDQSSGPMENIRKAQAAQGQSVDELTAKYERLNKAIDEYNRKVASAGGGGGGGAVGTGRGPTTGPTTWTTPGGVSGGGGVGGGGGAVGTGRGPTTGPTTWTTPSAYARPGGPGGPPGPPPIGPPPTGPPPTRGPSVYRRPGLIDLPDLPSKQQIALERMYAQYDKMGLFKTYNKQEATAAMVQQVFPGMSDDAARKYAANFLKQKEPAPETPKTIGSRIKGAMGIGTMATHAMGGPGELMGAGMGALQGLAGLVTNPVGLGALGLGMTVLGGTMAAMKLAQPALAFDRRFGAFHYTMPGGQEALMARTRAGAGFGYMPEETAAQLQQMQRIGGGKAWGAVAPFQQMRGMGMEAENWMPFAGAAAAAGARNEQEWQRIAKIIGITISEKSNLPRVMEEMTGLIQTFTGRAGEMTEASIRSAAILTKWGEVTGSAMLTGERGAAFWGKVGAVVGGTREPNLEMYMYDILNKNPEFRALMAQKGTAFTPMPAMGEADLTAWQMRKARARGPEASWAILAAAATQPGATAEQQERGVAAFGLNENEAELFRNLYLQYGGDKKKIEEEFKKSEGLDLKTAMMAGQDSRVLQAKQNQAMLDAGNLTKENTALIQKRLAEFIDKMAPALNRMAAIVAHFMGEDSILDKAGTKELLTQFDWAEESYFLPGIFGRTFHWKGARPETSTVRTPLRRNKYSRGV